MQLKVDEDLLRQPPTTGAKTALKLRSMPPVEQWWRDRLADGRVFSTSKKWEDHIQRAVAHKECRDELHTLGIGRRPTISEFLQTIERLCPSIKRRKLHGKPREWTLPTLDEARRDFEKYVGGPVKWEDDGQPELGDEDAPF